MCVCVVCECTCVSLQSANIKIGDFPGEVEVHVRLFAKKKVIRMVGRDNQRL